MSDETPAAAAAPAPVVAPAPFRFTSLHLAGIGAASYFGNEQLRPLIDWAIHGGQPTDAAESSLATLGSAAVALLVIYFTRGRAGVAAVLNGDNPNAS